MTSLTLSNSADSSGDGDTLLLLPNLWISPFSVLIKYKNLKEPFDSLLRSTLTINSVSNYGIGIKTVPWPLSGSQQSILDRPRQEHKPRSSKELKLVFFLQSAVWSQDPRSLSHLRLKRLLLDAAVVRWLLLVVRGRRVGGGGGAVRRLRPLIGGLRGGVGGFRGRIGGGCRSGVGRSCWCFVGRGGGRVSKRGFRCGKEGGEARAAVEGMSFHLCK